MKPFHATVVAAALLIGPTPPPTAAAPSLASRPFTVIAVLDTGIDPYHFDFRRPELTAHPSTYVEGFPRDAIALDLTFEGSYGHVTRVDRPKWRGIEENRLYWIPGTNIIGAMGPFDYLEVADQEVNFAIPGPPAPVPPFRDENGHGTSVASLAGGSIHGPGSEDILIVALKGYEDALAWAANQPWIDVITNSWWNPVGSVDRTVGAEASRLAVERGKVVCFASHNYSHPAWYSSTQGPSWSVNVGAASARTRGEHYYTDYPNDVLGLSAVPAATPGSFYGEDEKFAGTSAATPNVCGLIAKTLSEAREQLHDFHQGPVKGTLAQGRRAPGALSDGLITNEELEDAVQSTAVAAEASAPDPEDQYSVPASPVAPFLRGGYGIVDQDSAERALMVLLGLADRPDRALEDMWIEITDSLRDAIWGEGP